MKWFASILVVFLPKLVSAQAGGLVTCSGPDCTMCDFVNMINGIVEWLFGFLVLAAVLALMITGFRLVTSAGNESAWTSAKSMFTNIIIGLVIVLSAWLIVDTIMKAFIDPESGFGMWNKIEDCGSMFGSGSRDEDSLYCYSTEGAGITNVRGISACEAAREGAIASGFEVSSCTVCG